MISQTEHAQILKETLEYFEKAQITLTEEEVSRLEIADFGLNQIRDFGLQLIEYVNTDRCCAKDLVLLPRQTCPEHLHPPVGDSPGKEETFRCRLGTVHLYVPGESVANPLAVVPEHKKETFTVWNEVTLQAGEQYTLAPNTLHWFQAGDKGALISEFSTTSTDENDIFTDPSINRIPVIEQ